MPTAVNHTMQQLSIRRYTLADQPLWDEFVARSRNATFLFLRRYMDYHSDRFCDHSLVFTDEHGQLAALLPANERGRDLHTHQGLTYGGFLLLSTTRAVEVGQMLEMTMAYLRDRGFKTLHYRQIPQIYHRLPSMEDVYWLWRQGAVVEACGLSTTVELHPVDSVTPHVSKSRRKNANRLRRAGYTIEWDADLSLFWPVLTDNLVSTHGVKPVHSEEEMHRLQNACPENIVCHIIRNADGVVEAGVLLYLMPNVVHAQYASASPEGKDNAALDLLLLSVIDHYREMGVYRYFDFGISTEQMGRYLNESLMEQKERFGATPTLYNTYRLSL